MLHTEILDEVAFNQLKGIIVDGQSSSPPEKNSRLPALVLTFVHELFNLNYSISKELFDALCCLPGEADKRLADLLAMAKDSVGANAVWNPFYPNFPKQVIDTSSYELLMNAYMHYGSLGLWRPEDMKEERTKLTEVNKLKEIKPVTMKDVKNYFLTLLKSKTSYPPTLDSFVDYGIQHGWSDELDGPIIYKQTMSKVAAYKLSQGKKIDDLVQTSTDILRIMAAVSDADVTLRHPVRFKSMKRKTRRLIISALEKCITVKDVKPYAKLWILAFHCLHVGEYGGKVKAVADEFRNTKNVITVDTNIGESIKTGNMGEAARLLQPVPSVFCRALDKLVRSSCNEATANAILDQFEEMASKTDTKILLQMYGHFKKRNSDIKQRLVLTDHWNCVIPSLQKLPKAYLERIQNIISEKLQTKLSGKNLLKGKNVYFPRDLRKILVPLQLDNVTSSKDMIARGSRVPLDTCEADKKKNTLRLFINWIGQDQDLSALISDSSFNRQEMIYFRSTKNKFAQHSGDIVNAPAPDGASEFIDIDMQAALNEGFRYVSMDVRVYSGPSFALHERSMAGIMLREAPQSGEAFEPSTVKIKFNTFSPLYHIIAATIDLKTRELCWIDSKMKIDQRENAVDSYQKQSRCGLQAMLDLIDMKPTMYELLQFHMQDAKEVHSKSEADFHVGLGEGDLDLYDFSAINSKWI